MYVYILKIPNNYTTKTGIKSLLHDQNYTPYYIYTPNMTMPKRKHQTLSFFLFSLSQLLLSNFSMGNQNGDSTVINSSIALLQERFRELQKVREKRKEKELLKLFAESDHSSGHVAPSLNLEPSKLTFQPGMVDPNRRAQAVDESLLSLGLNSHSRHVDARATKSPANAWKNSSSASTSSSSRSFENSDVDTSLHL